MRKPPSTLGELVAPLSDAEIIALLRERRLTLLRGADRERYTSLLDWDTLLKMIARGETPRSLNEFFLTKESVMVPPERWLSRAPDGGNRVDVAKVEAYLAQGFSLVFNRVDMFASHLAALRDAIKAQLLEQIKIGVIVTTGSGGAFKLHYDPEDLIILQVEGTKRWRAYGPAVSHPVAGMPAQTPPPEEAPVLDEELRAGDFLFVPGGTWHHCENGPGRSVHLGIFFTPPTAWHAVKALTSDLLADEMFRQPITRLPNADRKALAAAAKAHIMERLARMEPETFLADWIK